MNPEIAARLQAFHIECVATGKGYTFYIRDNCAAIGHGASLGSSGIMTDTGLAYLTWREGRAYLAAHGGAESLAAPEQIETLRRFSDDLKAALNP